MPFLSPRNSRWNEFFESLSSLILINNFRVKNSKRNSSDTQYL
ncbi:hypothetical protein EMIT0162MI3_10804 [Pseudomonas chlororaphis]